VMLTSKVWFRQGNVPISCIEGNEYVLVKASLKMLIAMVLMLAREFALHLPRQIYV
jgi:hypothetical protein